MTYYKNQLLAFAVFVGLSACNKVEITPPIIDTPNNSTVTSNQVIAGNTQFAINLYRELVDENENQLLSPYSVSTALAMVYAGADANTATEIKNVFGFGANNANFHQTFNQLTNAIEGTISSAPNSTLNVVNKIWRSQNLAFLPSFETIMNTDYLAPVAVTDFTQSAAARQLINDWVDTETHQLIPELIPSGFIKPETATVLVNALYFKSDWEHQFGTFGTSSKQFTTSSGTTVMTDMMSDLIPTEDLKFTEDANVEVLELFFKNKQSSMVILLPKNTNLGINSFVQQHLTYNNLTQWLNNLAYPVAGSNFSIGLPKWDFNSDFDLKETLQVLGLNEAFTESANFKKMTTTSVAIDQIKHKSAIKTHEGGVEAAAATAVGIVVTSVPPVAKTILANRPFVFLIKDTETKSILFIGHVQNPNE